MCKLLLAFKEKIFKSISTKVICKRNQRVVNKNMSIISNNCIGADISKKLGLRYNSPTVNLQILPSQYVKFISNLSYYLTQELQLLDNFTEDQEKSIYELYGRLPMDLAFPFGIIDNEIIVCFQHYKSFSEAKCAWDRRKMRVSIDDCAYVYIADAFKHEDAIREFCNVSLPNKLLFILSTTGKYPEWISNIKEDSRLFVFKCYCPKGKHFMEMHKGQTV